MRGRILVGILCLVSLILLIPHARSHARPVPAASPDECPSVAIKAEGDCCGSKCKFIGAVAGWSPWVEPVVRWEVSGGKIVSGQGTTYIKVAPHKSRVKPMTVTLRVSGEGLPKACEVEEIYEVAVCPRGRGR
jgi:hypothetical protein